MLRPLINTVIFFKYFSISVPCNTELCKSVGKKCVYGADAMDKNEWATTFRTSLPINLHCWASCHSQGFEEKNLGSSPGLLGQ